MELTINPNRIELDEAYMQMAEVWAKRSKANRLQVGALIVKGQQIISDGYNGMPSGVADDVCEYWHGDELRTKPEVLHAESNALLKISKNGGTGAEGGTLYTTYSPCTECAKLIKQAKINRVVYRHVYRLPDGIELLMKLGVEVVCLKGQDTRAPAQPAPAPMPAPVAAPAQAPRQSLLQQVMPSANEKLVNSLRAQAPTPAPAAVIDPPKLPPAIPPIEVDPDVERLLREFEAHQAQQAGAKAPAASTMKEESGGGYRSNFL